MPSLLRTCVQIIVVHSPLLYLVVARERSFYVLVLRRSRHPTFPGQISEKLRHSRFCHLTRMPLIMKKDEPANPIHIGLFGFGC